MSLIIRLQNLPWNASAFDIRNFFRGLSIPDGGVHVIGGENGDAFVTFSTDGDAQMAMIKDTGRINGCPIRLLFSSTSEMQTVIAAAEGRLPTPMPAASTSNIPKPVGFYDRFYDRPVFSPVSRDAVPLMGGSGNGDFTGSGQGLHSSTRPGSLPEPYGYPGFGSQVNSGNSAQPLVRTNKSRAISPLLPAARPAFDTRPSQLPYENRHAFGAHETLGRSLSSGVHSGNNLGRPAADVDRDFGRGDSQLPFGRRERSVPLGQPGEQIDPGRFVGDWTETDAERPESGLGHGRSSGGPSFGGRDVANDSGSEFQRPDVDRRTAVPNRWLESRIMGPDRGPRDIMPNERLLPKTKALDLQTLMDRYGFRSPPVFSEDHCFRFGSDRGSLGASGIPDSRPRGDSRARFVPPESGFPHVLLDKPLQPGAPDQYWAQDGRGYGLPSSGFDRMPASVPRDHHFHAVGFLSASTEDLSHDVETSLLQPRPKRPSGATKRKRKRLAAEQAGGNGVKEEIVLLTSSQNLLTSHTRKESTAASVAQTQTRMAKTRPLATGDMPQEMPARKRRCVQLPEESLEVAIIFRGDRTQKFTKKVRKHFWKGMDKISNTMSSGPRFHKCQWDDGKYRITCVDQASVAWLKDSVPRIDAVQGHSFEAVDTSELSRQEIVPGIDAIELGHLSGFNRQTENQSGMAEKRPVVTGDMPGGNWVKQETVLLTSSQNQPSSPTTASAEDPSHDVEANLQQPKPKRPSGAARRKRRRLAAEQTEGDRVKEEIVLLTSSQNQPTSPTRDEFCAVFVAETETAVATERPAPTVDKTADSQVNDEIVLLRPTSSQNQPFSPSMTSTEDVLHDVEESLPQPRPKRLSGAARRKIRRLAAEQAGGNGVKEEIVLLTSSQNQPTSPTMVESAAVSVAETQTSVATERPMPTGDMPEGNRVKEEIVLLTSNQNQPSSPTTTESTAASVEQTQISVAKERPVPLGDIHKGNGVKEEMVLLTSNQNQPSSPTREASAGASVGQTQTGVAKVIPVPIGDIYEGIRVKEEIVLLTSNQNQFSSPTIAESTDASVEQTQTGMAKERPMSMEDAPQEMLALKRQSVQFPEESLEVAIIFRGDPARKVKRKVRSHLWRQLVKLIDMMPQNSQTPGPRFDKTGCVDGKFRITCADQASLAWLKESVPKIEGVQGHGFEVVDLLELYGQETVAGMDAVKGHGSELGDQSGLNRQVRVRVWLPRVRSDPRTVFARLAKQNPGLDTSGWQVVHQCAKESGQFLVLGISEESLQKLRSMQGKVYLELSQVTFKLPS